MLGRRRAAIAPSDLHSLFPALQDTDGGNRVFLFSFICSSGFDCEVRGCDGRRFERKDVMAPGNVEYIIIIHGGVEHESHKSCGA